MPESPLAQLDARFSQPDAVATPWEATVQVLEQGQMFLITTVRTDGRPHVTPLVAVWLDGRLHFTTGPDEQKGVNLRSNAHVILSTGSDQWTEGLDVVVEGVAARVVEPDELSRLAEAWTTKWDGRWEWVIGDGCFHHSDGDGDVENEQPGDVLVFAVTPAKVLAFARGTFGQTSYTF